MYQNPYQPTNGGFQSNAYQSNVHPYPTQEQSPRLDMSMARPQYQAPEQPAESRTYGGAVPTQTPVAPVSKVKEQSIKIPDFFKR